MRYCTGNIRTLSDASTEVARLHAFCDIINEYSMYSTEERRIVDSNVGYALQVIHDLVADLDSVIERLALDAANTKK